MGGEEVREIEAQVKENIDTAKIGEADITAMITAANLHVSIYQMPTGRIIWKSAVGDQQLESVLSTIYAEVHKHNILSETVTAVLKVIEKTYSSNLFGPDGKKLLNVQ